MSSDQPSRDDLRQFRSELQRLREQLGALGSRIDLWEAALEHESPAASEAGSPTARREPFVPPVAPQVANPAVPARIFEAEVVSENEQDVTWAPVESVVGGNVPYRVPGARPASPRPTSRDWERMIGERWMTWVGAFTLILAVGFTVHWAWSTFQAPAWLQVFCLHLLGLGFLGGAAWAVKRQLPILGQALAGLGIFTLYTIAFAALLWYHVWPAAWEYEFAFGEGVAITILAIAIALRANSPAIILIGALGGYITPLITSSGGGNYVGLFSYLAFLNVALCGAAVIRGWSFLKPLAVFATSVMFALWIASGHFNDLRAWGTEWFAVLHAVIFLATATLPPLLWQRRSNTFDLIALSGGSLGFMGLTWLIFRDWPEQQLALVSWGLSLLHFVLFAVTYARVTNADRMPRVHLALAAVFFTVAIPLQVNDASFWGVTWVVEALIFTTVGVYFRDRQMCITALVVMCVAAIRLFAFDYSAPPRLIGDTGVDQRFAMFLLAGLLSMASAAIYWLLPRALDRREALDPVEVSIRNVLQAMGATLLMFAPTLQLHDFIYLGLVWSGEALAFTAAGLLTRSSQLCFTGTVAFIAAATRIFGWDFLDDQWAQTGAAFDLRFMVIAASAAAAMIAGTLYWLLGQWLDAHADEAALRRNTSMALLAGGNLALLAGFWCQWPERMGLVLWIVDVAIVWVVGFYLDKPAVRWYAAALALVLVGGRAVYHGPILRGPYRLLANTRFETLALVAVLYFAAGWGYRRLKLAAQHAGVGGWASTAANLDVRDESLLDPLFGILANVVLLIGLSLEIDSWFRAAAAAGNAPFADMRMAEMATYSIVWAIYAALLIAFGFVLRYPLFRFIGLAAFVPILAKVFLVDLGHLRLLPRVLALAVLGMMLLGVSLLYQRFSRRIDEQTGEQL